MIVSFGDKGTEDVFNGRRTRDANRACPAALWRVARRKLDQLDTVSRLQELSVPPGNRLEALRGDRQRLHSIRINQQYRISFVWTDAGPGTVTIVDYH
jgi:proteic killer suppression protein